MSPLREFVKTYWIRGKPPSEWTLLAIVVTVIIGVVVALQAPTPNPPRSNWERAWDAGCLIVEAFVCFGIIVWGVVALSK